MAASSGAAAAAAALALPAHRFAVLEGAAGADLQRRGNAKLVAASPLTLGYVAGNALRLHNVQDGAVRTLFASAAYGVGAFALHPAGHLLAVAERAPDGQFAPAIVIYSVPGLRRLCALEGGTERAFADVNFRCVPPRPSSVERRARACVRWRRCRCRWCCGYCGCCQRVQALRPQL